MVGIKNIKLPDTCWDCELTHDNYTGYTVCTCTGKVLYPIGTENDREKMNCPLVELPNVTC